MQFAEIAKTKTEPRHIPHLAELTSAYIHYWRISEAAVREIHARHRSFRVNRLKPPAIRGGRFYPHDEKEEIDIHKESVAANLHLKDAAEAHERDKIFKNILKCSEQFPPYISEAYVVIV